MGDKKISQTQILLKFPIFQIFQISHKQDNTGQSSTRITKFLTFKQNYRSRYKGAYLQIRTF